MIFVGVIYVVKKFQKQNDNFVPWKDIIIKVFVLVEERVEWLRTVERDNLFT